MGNFQTRVTTQPALGVAGDFASANPYFTYDAGPGGLVTGANGLTVGRFAWVQPYPLDADNAPTVANNTGSGSVAGFAGRQFGSALITSYLATSSMTIIAGHMCTLFTGGDFLAQNDGTGQALIGQKAYADYGTGKVTFAATATPATGGSSTSASIAAAPTTSVTGSISGDVLTVTAIGTGKLVVGGTLAGSAGSAGGVAVVTGTKIVSQLTGGTSGSVGTYTVDIGEQNVASTTITEAYGVLTVGGSVTNAFAVGDTIGGTDGTSTVAATYITALGTGTGGTGTYIVNKTQTLNATTVTAYGNVETKWIAMSSGAPGELVKISSHPLG